MAKAVGSRISERRHTRNKLSGLWYIDREEEYIFPSLSTLRTG